LTLYQSETVQIIWLIKIEIVFGNIENK
jgi:hypothetical protein